MTKIGNLKDFSDNIFIMLNKIRSCPELLKLLYYTNDDPLSQPDLTEDQIDKMINKHIRLVPKLSLFSAEDIYSAITFIVGNVTKIEQNKQFYESDLQIVVNCPLELWSIEHSSDLRIFLIMSLINGLLDNLNIGSVGRLHFEGIQLTISDDYNAGYIMMYTYDMFGNIK